MKFLMLIFLASTLAFAGQGPNFSHNRLIIKVKKGQQLPPLKNALTSKKLFGNIFVVYTESIEKLSAELEKSTAIKYIEKDFKAKKREIAKLAETPAMKMGFLFNSPFNDPQVGRLWAFDSAADNGISINKAYENLGTSKNAIIVAVVDTGVDYAHEDLKEVMWINKNEIPNNGIDDDKNGIIDDVHGINTLMRDENQRATGKMKDTHGHGTHVSGTIGAKQNNAIGIAGIASNVQIMGIRAVPNSGDETDVDLIESFIYAAKHGAKIINCSFGKSHNEGGMAVSEAIDHIGEEYGVLVIAAAGNSSEDIDRNLTYPASFENENLLVVAATQSWGGLSFFSNYGQNNVDLAAPGTGIYSTIPGGYSSMSGTSMAAPTTAGVAAEVWSRNPALANIELKQILMDSVTKVRRFRNKMMAGGRVDLEKALAKAANY